MKKLFALLLCAAMALGVLVGCTPDSSETTEGTGEQKTTGYGAKAPEGYTLTIGLPVSSMVEDYETNSFTLWLEEQSGYNLKFVTYATGANDFQAQVATEFQLPDWDMPDILWGMNLGRQAVKNYGDGGYLYNLAYYYNNEEYSGVWWDRLEELGEDDPDFVEWYKARLYIDREGDEDKIYYFPTLERNQMDMIRYQVYINQEWLDKLNLPMPTNKEELYDTLVAFRDKDPNGNAQKDEIPLFGAAGQLYGDVVSWITNMFCYQEDARSWRVDENGKLSPFFWDDGYREALIFMNKLVKEGLMPESVFTTTSNEITNLVNPLDGVETVGIWLAHATGAIVDGSDAVNVYKAMPYWGNVVLDQPRYADDTYITTDCEYPDAAWEILMLMSSKEGAYRMRYGEKGVDWVDAAPGTKAFTGLDAEINVLNHGAFNSGNSNWHKVNCTLAFANENERSELSDNLSAANKARLELMGECFKNAYSAYEAQGGRPADVVMPFIYTIDEDKDVSIARSNCENWFRSCRANFIKGAGEFNDPSNNAQWQKYIDGFTANGLSTWQDIAQVSYDYTYGSMSGK